MKTVDDRIKIMKMVCIRHLINRRGLFKYNKYLELAVANVDAPH